MREDGIEIRPGTVDDIEDLVRLRRLMFTEMGFRDPARLEAADEACRAYFARTVPTGDYRAWVAQTPAGRIVACGGAVVDQHPPGPDNLDGRVGYVMNLSTEPEYRRRGLCRAILNQIMSWVRTERIALVSLHATEVGRLLYRQFGFVESNEMRLRIGGER
jgi:ribosomal protein S18 acetylase RimI-like enzyme